MIGEHMADFACGTGDYHELAEPTCPQSRPGDQEAYDNSNYGVEKKQFPICVHHKYVLHGLDVPRIYHNNSYCGRVGLHGGSTSSTSFENPPYGGL
jgi:type I restriction enzyme M protein